MEEAKKYKILALDIDGTLTDSKKEITPRVNAAIDRLHSDNIPVLLVSGRPTEGIIPIANEIDLFQNAGYILAFNGGKIIDCKTNEVVYNKYIPEELVPHICNFAYESGLTVLTYKDGKIISNNADDEFLAIEARINKMEAVKVDDLIKEAPAHCDKFLLVGDEKLCEKKVEEMAELFKDKLNIFRSEPFFIEVVPKGIDKAESLEVLLSKLGLTRDDLVACGDGRNDVTMVNYAGMGVAMENACDDVKKVADFITASNDQDGVAIAIEKFFKGEIL